MRVLVLTDYYPLKLLLGQMSVLIGQQWLALRARHLVKHDAARPGIEALAKALIERRELSGTEACKVIVEAKRRRASLLMAKHSPAALPEYTSSQLRQ
jgi:hypothetical protein